MTKLSSAALPNGDAQPMTNPKDVAARLRELLAHKTPGPWMVYSEPDVGLPPSLFAGKPMETGFGPIEPLSGVDLDLIVEAINALPALLDQNERMAKALGKAITRFEFCADMIADSFSASGTLRAERTIKARHFALEARNALNPENA